MAGRWRGGGVGIAGEKARDEGAARGMAGAVADRQGSHHRGAGTAVCGENPGEGDLPLSRWGKMVCGDEGVKRGEPLAPLHFWQLVCLAHQPLHGNTQGLRHQEQLPVTDVPLVLLDAGDD